MSKDQKQLLFKEHLGAWSFHLIIWLRGKETKSSAYTGCKSTIWRPSLFGTLKATFHWVIQEKNPSSLKEIVRKLVSLSLFFKIYLFIYFWLWSLLLRLVSLQLRQAGATLRCGVRASHCGGFSCCRARALGMRASVVWLAGLVAPRHVGSSRTMARTRVPCIGRQILNHCTTREARKLVSLDLTSEWWGDKYI